MIFIDSESGRFRDFVKDFRKRKREKKNTICITYF